MGAMVLVEIAVAEIDVVGVSVAVAAWAPIAGVIGVCCVTVADAVADGVAVGVAVGVAGEVTGCGVIADSAARLLSRIDEERGEDQATVRSCTVPARQTMWRGWRHMRRQASSPVG